MRPSLCAVILFAMATLMTQPQTAPAADPWTEIVKYEANHKGQAPFTVESVEAFRVPSGKLVVRMKQTRVRPQPGDKITFGNGDVIVIKKAEAQSVGGTMIGTIIHDPLPPKTAVPTPKPMLLQAAGEKGAGNKK